MAKNSRNRKSQSNDNVTFLESQKFYKDRTPLEPLNDRQAEYINAIQTSSVIICTGVLGSSKTYIPSVMAADAISAKEASKIIIARPSEGVGKGNGFLPGTSDEKLLPWCAPIVETMKKRMGDGNFTALLENGRIELLDLSRAKGRSFDDTWMLIDEAEDIEVDVVKNLVTRQGIRSKLILTGDVAQQDLKKNSGLEYILRVIKANNLPVAVIDFDSWDHCVRGQEAKMWGMAFEDYERFYKG